MIYITSPELFRGSLIIGMALGKMPPDCLLPSFDADTVLDLEEVHIRRSGPMWLLLAAHTGSWCLLSDFEAAVATSAKKKSFDALRRNYSMVDAAHLEDFFGRLFQRGLLRVNGRPGLDPAILSQGALFSESNLVELLVTQKCNLACHYCLAEAGPDMSNMELDVAYLAVDAAFRLPSELPLFIELSGGEPFVNFHLFKSIVGYIEKKQEESGRRVHICTQSNGTLISDEIARFLKEHEIGIGVSIDGPSHLGNLTRPLLGGGASHDKTVRGIKTLQRHGINCGVIVVLSRMNVGHPEEIADFLVAQKVHRAKINPIDRVGKAQHSWDKMSVSGNEYFVFMERFIDHVIDTSLILSEDNLAAYLGRLVFREHKTRCMRSNCGAGKSFFVIDAKGDVYPCAHSSNLPEWRIGNIDEAKGDLIRLGTCNSIVEQFHRRLVDQIPETTICSWRHFCEGGCAVNAYQHYDSILAPDPRCSFYELVYPWLFERLATEPQKFQHLLDLTIGKDRAEVISFDLAEGLEGFDGIDLFSFNKESLDTLLRKEGNHTKYHPIVKRPTSVIPLNTAN